MTESTYVPRLSVEIRQDQDDALKRILPHGTKKIIFHAIIDGIIALHTKGGFSALAPIMTGHIDVVTLAKAGHPYTEDQYEVKDGNYPIP